MRIQNWRCGPCAPVREFLTEPTLQTSAAEALVRTSARRVTMRQRKKTTGKLFVFVGAKGGAGVTTIASNFAVALAQESGDKVALIDLDLELGDAALTLGLTTKYTVLDALENPSRLDSDFLSVLFAKHGSGLMVLGAPDAIPPAEPSLAGIEKSAVRRGRTSLFVVIDAGAHSIEKYQALFPGSGQHGVSGESGRRGGSAQREPDCFPLFHRR